MSGSSVQEILSDVEIYFWILTGHADCDTDHYMVVAKLRSKFQYVNEQGEIWFRKIWSEKAQWRTG
jgi:hypothetical protein